MHPSQWAFRCIHGWRTFLPAVALVALLSFGFHRVPGDPRPSTCCRPLCHPGVLPASTHVWNIPIPNALPYAWATLSRLPLSLAPAKGMRVTGVYKTPRVLPISTRSVTFPFGELKSPEAPEPRRGGNVSGPRGRRYPSPDSDTRIELRTGVLGCFGARKPPTCLRSSRESGSRCH